MSIIEKLNLILKKAGISKVNFAKYLGVSRQMVYNYLENGDLTKWPKDKKASLYRLLSVNSDEEIENLEINNELIESVESKIFTTSKKAIAKKEETIDISGFKKEEQEMLNDIVFALKEILNEDRTHKSLATITYVYNLLQSMSTSKEVKYILAYISKAAGFTKPTIYEYEEEYQFVFESLMYSAMTLYNNGGASRTKLAESHRRWEAELEQKNEEKLSRTQELNSAKVQALKELGYSEINEKNAGEVFDKIAEIQARKI